MAFTNRWGLRDVATLKIFDIVTGALKAKLDTLKMSELDVSETTVYATGSSGAPKLIGFTSQKGAKLNIKDALFNNDIFGVLTGNDVVTAATPIVQDDVLTVTSNSATLTYTPNATGALISVNKLNSDGTVGAALSYVSSAPTALQYSITGKALTFSAGAIADGSKVQVFYNTLSGTDTKQIKVSTNKFATSYKILADVIVTDFYTKQLFHAQITVPNGKIDGNFKLTMAPDGNPSELDFSIEALKPAGSTDLYTMYIFDDTELT